MTQKTTETLFDFIEDHNTNFVQKSCPDLMIEIFLFDVWPGHSIIRH